MKKEPNLEGILKRSNKYSNLAETNQGLYEQVAGVILENVKLPDLPKNESKEDIMADLVDYYVGKLLDYETDTGEVDQELRDDVKEAVSYIFKETAVAKKLNKVRSERGRKSFKRLFKSESNKYYKERTWHKQYAKELEGFIKSLGEVPKLQGHHGSSEEYSDKNSDVNLMFYLSIQGALEAINEKREISKRWGEKTIEKKAKRLRNRFLGYEKRVRVTSGMDNFVDKQFRGTVRDIITEMYAPEGVPKEDRIKNLDAIFDRTLALRENPSEFYEKTREALTQKEKKRKGVKVGLYSTIVAAEAAVAVWFYFNTIKPAKEHLNDAYIGAKVTFDTALYLFGLGEQADLDKEIISNAKQAYYEGNLNQEQLEQIHENLEAVLPAGKSNILQKYKDDVKEHESMLQEYSKSLDTYIANCDSVKTKLKLLKKDANYLSAQLFEIIPKKILGDDGKEEKTDEKKNEKKEDKSIWEKAKELGKDAVDTMRKIRDKLGGLPEGTTEKQAQEFIEKAIKGFEQHHNLNKVKTQLEALVKEYDKIEGSLNEELGHYQTEKQNVQKQLKQLSQIEGVLIEATSSGKDATAVMKIANKIYQDINDGVYVDRSKEVDKAKNIVKERGLEGNVRELNIYKDLPAFGPLEVLYGAGILAFLAVQTGLVKAATAPVRVARKAGGLVKAAVRYNPATLILYDGTRLGKTIYRKTQRGGK